MVLMTQAKPGSNVFLQELINYDCQDQSPLNASSAYRGIRRLSVHIPVDARLPKLENHVR